MKRGAAVVVVLALAVGLGARGVRVQGGQVQIADGQSAYSWATQQAAKWAATGTRCEYVTVVNQTISGGASVGVTFRRAGVDDDQFVLLPCEDAPMECSMSSKATDAGPVDDVIFDTGSCSIKSVNCGQVNVLVSCTQGPPNS